MIGMNLKYLRKKYGYSQEDLAERLEVSRQSVAKWENEESLPDVEKCVTMAQIFETTVEMLLVCPFYEEESDGLTSDGDGKSVYRLRHVCCKLFRTGDIPGGRGYRRWLWNSYTSV